MIINTARALRDRRAPPLDNGKAPSLTTFQLAQRVDSLVDEGRLSAAAVVVDRIAAKISGAPNPPVLSLDAIREHINRLHPAADEQDALPEAAADPPGDEIIVANVR